MKKKRIYILNGHPAEMSLSRTFAETYARSARLAGHETRMSHLSDMRFDADFGCAGFADAKVLEPVLERVLEDIEWSEHVVMTSPMWWGGLPAKLKGLIDRAFLPGRTFDTKMMKNGLPRPMLSGRTARVILTSDTPGWFMRLVYKNALFHQLGRQIFGFVGLKPVKFTHFSAASHPVPDAVDRWIRKVEKIGSNGL